MDIFRLLMVDEYNRLKAVATDPESPEKWKATVIDAITQIIRMNGMEMNACNDTIEQVKLEHTTQVANFIAQQTGLPVLPPTSQDFKDGRIIELETAVDMACQYLRDGAPQRTIEVLEVVRKK